MKSISANEWMQVSLILLDLFYLYSHFARCASKLKFWFFLFYTFWVWDQCETWEPIYWKCAARHYWTQSLGLYFKYSQCCRIATVKSVITTFFSFSQSVSISQKLHRCRGGGGLVTTTFDLIFSQAKTTWDFNAFNGNPYLYTHTHTDAHTLTRSHVKSFDYKLCDFSLSVLSYTVKCCVNWDIRVE